MSTKTLYSNKVTVTGMGVRASVVSLEGYNSTHISTLHHTYTRGSQYLTHSQYLIPHQYLTQYLHWGHFPCNFDFSLTPTVVFLRRLEASMWVLQSPSSWGLSPDVFTEPCGSQLLLIPQEPAANRLG